VKTDVADGQVTESFCHTHPPTNSTGQHQGGTVMNATAIKHTQILRVKALVF